MERDPFQPLLLLFERTDWDTGGARVLITRQAVLLLLLGFYCCCSCCPLSVLQRLPWQRWAAEGEPTSPCCNAGVNGVNPVLKPRSVVHLQLSLHCNFLNPFLYSRGVG